MSTKEWKTIRFSVRSPDSFRSSTWRCWTQTGGGKHDFYIMCRALRGALKTSMHQSGQWHVAFTKEFIDKTSGETGWTQDDRKIDVWQRPAEIAPGITLAYRLVIPGSALTIRSKPDNDKDIVWIPSSPKGMATEISFLLTLPNVVCSDWPGKRSMNTGFVGSLLMENDATLWIVHRITSVPQLSALKGQTTWFNSYDIGNLPAEDLRAVVVATADDGSKFLFESAIERSNATLA